jgi:hypothetical protein
MSGIALACLLQGCSEPPPPEPEPLRLEIGVHDVSLKTAAGWSHFDHGREHRFRRGIAQISLRDAGPGTTGGFLREIRHAWGLYSRRQVEEARVILGRLDLRAAFENKGRWDEFESYWKTAWADPRASQLDASEVHHAYKVVLKEVENVGSPSMAQIVDRALPELENGPHRAVANQQAVAIDGREAIVLQTWDKLSHSNRRNYLFVLNRGNLLVARTDLGDFSELEPVFRRLVDSLEIHGEEGI